MTNYSISNSKNKLQKRIFTPKLTDSDTISFAFLAAEKGLTPEQLIESFVCDIVSSFYTEKISEEEKSLADWFNSSWFSQDNDGCFSFLQYIIRNNFYKYITAALTEIKIRNTKILKHKKPAKNKKFKAKCEETVKKIFNKYCKKNPAHKSFAEEIKIIRDFDNYINKNSKGRKIKWN